LTAQSKKKMKNKARLPRTAGLRTLSDLTADLTKAGIDPSRVQERAVMIAKVRAAGSKRKRDGDEDGMDVDGDDRGDGDDDDDDWASEGEDDTSVMDVDGEAGTRRDKRSKANSGVVIARKRAPRSNRQLAGLRDEAVRFVFLLLLLLFPLLSPLLSCGADGRGGDLFSFWGRDCAVVFLFHC
jgi:nucleolar GTP-binding protein